MELNDVFQRNKAKTESEEVVLNPQDLMVGLKKDNEESKTAENNETNFDLFDEITEKTREDLIARDITSLFPIQVA